jgi:hypothetical protein
MKLKKIVGAFAMLGVAVLMHSCFIVGMSGKYSFTGASIPANAQTFSVAYIPNNAANVSATLSNALTEGLRDRFSRQTRLTMVPEEGDLAFEGEIISDVEAPTAIGAADGNQDAQAAMNRVTVTVRIRFVNALQPELSFAEGKTFTAYSDFDAVRFTRQQVESTLVEEIVNTLVDNIFNASVAQWN